MSLLIRMEYYVFEERSARNVNEFVGRTRCGDLIWLVRELACVP